jgi:hypothetical protein
MTKVVITAAIAFCAATSAPKAAVRVTGDYGAWRSVEDADVYGEPVCGVTLVGADRAR